MFSPKDATHLATSAGKKGAQIIDIRSDPNRFVKLRLKFNLDPSQLILLYFFRHLLHFPSDGGVYCARYNGKGTRLLCNDAVKQFIIYDLPASVDKSSDITGKVRLTFQNGDQVPRHGRNSCCFAGKDDELVAAAAMKNDGLCVWSVPDGYGERVINEPLLLLRGNSMMTMGVRYSPQNCLLATCGMGKDSIKFWSPFKLPGSVGAVNFEPGEKEITTDEDDSSSNFASTTDDDSDIPSEDLMRSNVSLEEQLSNHDEDEESTEFEN